MKVTELREYDYGIVIILDDKFKISLNWNDVYNDSFKNSLVRLSTGSTAKEHYNLAIKTNPWPNDVNRTSFGEPPRSCRF